MIHSTVFNEVIQFLRTFHYLFRENIGFPIIDCNPDGTFAVTKPPKTGGLITRPVIAEQV